MYIPKNPAVRIVLARIIGIVMAVIGVGLVLVGVSDMNDDYELVPASSVSCKYMESYINYKFEDVIVVDAFAEQKTDDYTDALYCVIDFIDADGTEYFGALLIDADDDGYEKLKAYVDNEDAVIGDCRIDFVSSWVAPLTELDGELKTWYKEAVDAYATSEISDCALYFEYACDVDGYDDYVVSSKQMDKVMAAVGAAMIVVGIALAVLGFKLKLKSKSEPAQTTGDYTYTMDNNTATSSGTYYTPPATDTPEAQNTYESSPNVYQENQNIYQESPNVYQESPTDSE